MSNVSASTVARTIFLALSLINMILTGLGKNPLPFAEDAIYEVVTVLWTFVASAIAWWKNNSFTKNAIKADETLKELNTKTAESEE